MNYDWDWSFFLPYRTALVRGIWVTIQVSALSSIIGTLVGFVLGALYRSLPFRRIILLANDSLRAIPLLVLLLFFYTVPFDEFLGLEKALSPFIVTVIAMSLSQAAFTADLVFHAVDRVNVRTLESAQSLGLRSWTIWRIVIAPDILRQILPALIAFWIGIVKLSSLASVINCPDVVFVAETAGNQSYRSLEVWTLVMLVYIALVVPMTLTSRWIENSQWMKRR